MAENALKPHGGSSPRLGFGAFQFDPLGRVLFRDGSELMLPPRVLNVLVCLLERPGDIVPKQALLDAGWRDAHVTDASLAEAISSLRDALGDDPQRPSYVQTVHRRGYRFVSPVHLINEDGAASPELELVSSTEAISDDDHDPVRSRVLMALPWIVTGFSLLTAVSAVWQAARVSTNRVTPVVRLTLPLSGDERLVAQGAALAVSPDGRRLIYMASLGATSKLFLRDMDRLESRALDGSTGGSSPFFAPDGRSVGFFAEGKLKTLTLDGGALTTVAEARSPLGASWADDGSIVFAHRGGLSRVAASGGAVEAVVTPRPGSGEIAYLWPEVLPRSEAVIYTVQAPGPARVAVTSLVRGKSHRPLTSGSFARYSPTRHLVFVRGAALMAAAFDPFTLELTGPATAVLNDVDSSWPDGSARFAFSQSGALVYVARPAARFGFTTLSWLGMHGDQADLALPERRYTSLAMAPDLRHAALTVSDDVGSEVWVSELARGTLARLTHEGSSVDPIWTPDGSRVTYASGRPGPFNLYWQPTDGASPAERLAHSPNNQFPSSWSPDGQMLAYTEIDAGTRADILALDVQPSPHGQRALVRTPWDETAGVFSPDGRWLAYQSNESGRWEIYLSAYPPGHVRYPVSSGGGTAPFWSADGRALYYRDGPRVMAVTMPSTGASGGLSRPAMLFNRDDLYGGLAFANGQFLALREVDALLPRSATVVLGWFDELTRLVPQPLPALLR